MPAMLLLSLPLFVFAAAAMLRGGLVSAACPTGDCITYDISTQSVCEEKISNPTKDARWHDGLSLSMDQKILGGRIIAFQIQRPKGEWSGWYVPGVNDIDVKYNAPTNKMRRQWSYFLDHNVKYIICK